MSYQPKANATLIATPDELAKCRVAMAKPTKPLTNTQVKQSKPKDKEYKLFDGRGLTLRIRPNGAKTWLLNYAQPHTRKRVNLSFGSFPNVSLADARRKTDRALELLANDIDPVAQREEEKRKAIAAHGNTVEHVAQLWFEIKKSKVSAGYAEDIWSSLQLHIFPTLGKAPIHTVCAPRTIEILKPVARKGSLETVKRLCQRLNEVMVFAVNTGIIHHNPLAGIRHAFQTPQKKHFPTLKPEQLPDLMRQLSITSIRLKTRYLIEWQLHTMVRPAEAAGARWEEIDEVNKVWKIPAERMKRNHPHTVPLSTQAMSLLEALKEISGHREHIFPGDKTPRSHTNPQTANAALKRMALPGRLVSHGLRALASTTLNEEGFDPDVIEAALSHVDNNEIRRAYNRSDYLERRRPMMEWWSAHIEQAATGSLSLATGRSGLRIAAGGKRESSAN